MKHSRITAAVAAAALGLGLSLGVVAAPAAAHDTLLATDPAPDEVLATAPELIEFTYSAELMEPGRLVVVIDSAGTDWVDGEPTSQGTQLFQPLKPGMPEGSYQVRWQVVSSDGHPISGWFDFAVGEPTPGGIPAPGDVAEDHDHDHDHEDGEHDHADHDHADHDHADDGQGDGGADLGGLVLGVAAGGVVLAAVVLVIALNRRRKA